MLCTWRRFVGFWGQEGLQHGDCLDVGLSGPPYADWLVLGAVVHGWFLSLQARRFGCTGELPGAVHLSSPVSRLPSPVSRGGAARHPGPLWDIFRFYLAICICIYIVHSYYI